VEAKLRAGMARHGIEGRAADEIARSITSFALYGFPESHAASFALLAYASAYLKAHHPAAFYCALLNNWPMGFYHPATLVQDARRHGVRILPIDATRSCWLCTIEREGESAAADRREGASGARALAVRLGLRYVVGLREEAGRRIEEERARKPFASVEDVAFRCGLRAEELATLAEIGAFAAFGYTRREALWQVAGLPRGPLFEFRGSPRRASSPEARPRKELGEPESPCPLPPMTPLERTLSDYRGTGLTIGPHVMCSLRPVLRARGVLRASELEGVPNGHWVKVAGLVIVRQRPGTAKGFCFLTLEDESGIANAVVSPEMFQRHRALLHTAALLQVEGRLQKVDGVLHVRAYRFSELRLPSLPQARTAWR